MKLRSYREAKIYFKRFSLLRKLFYLYFYAAYPFNLCATSNAKNTDISPQDMKLKQLVDEYSERWDLISQHFADRSDMQCQQRWQKVVNPELVKGPWTKEVNENVRAKITLPCETSLMLNLVVRYRYDIQDESCTIKCLGIFSWRAFFVVVYTNLEIRCLTLALCICLQRKCSFVTLNWNFNPRETSSVFAGRRKGC